MNDKFLWRLFNIFLTYVNFFPIINNVTCAINENYTLEYHLVHKERDRENYPGYLQTILNVGKTEKFLPFVSRSVIDGSCQDHPHTASGAGAIGEDKLPVVDLISGPGVGEIVYEVTRS